MLSFKVRYLVIYGEISGLLRGDIWSFTGRYLVFYEEISGHLRGDIWSFTGSYHAPSDTPDT